MGSMDGSFRRRGAAGDEVEGTLGYPSYDTSGSSGNP